jgi:hypothetical protein
VTPRMVEPKCGQTRCKKTLTRKEYECEVPSYKCVVAYLCPTCASKSDGSGMATAEPPAAAGPARRAYSAPAPQAPLPLPPKPAKNKK